MDMKAIAVGRNAPQEVNVIVENPMGGSPVKYELDKDSGAMIVDRFIHTPMYYPGNYGFIPHTLSGDGDPVDVLIISNLAVVPGAVMAVRPVGVLLMEDESGMDEKIIAVPATHIYPYHENIKSCEDFPSIVRDQIEHFFTHYKDLEKNKWVKIIRWDNADQARTMINEGIERANKEK